MVWLLRRIVATRFNGMVAWDADVVDAFVDTFPEAKKTLRVYFVGPNSSPMLNRAAKRAEARGLLSAGHIGNQDARSYKQRTWCRYWSLTDKARALLGEPGVRR